MAKKRGRKPKKKEDDPVISETPVIDGEQANAPPKVEPPETPEPEPVGEPSQKDVMTIGQKAPPPETMPRGTVYKPQQHKQMPRSIDEIPLAKRPVVEKEPEPVPPSRPVICAGCKATVELSTTKLCPYCKGSLRYCRMCAKPGSCHKCGKTLK